MWYTRAQRCFCKSMLDWYLVLITLRWWGWSWTTLNSPFTAISIDPTLAKYGLTLDRYWWCRCILVTQLTIYSHFCWPNSDYLYIAMNFGLVILPHNSLAWRIFCPRGDNSWNSSVLTKIWLQELMQSNRLSRHSTYVYGGTKNTVYLYSS